MSTKKTFWIRKTFVFKIYVEHDVENDAIKLENILLNKIETIIYTYMVKGRCSTR